MNTLDVIIFVIVLIPALLGLKNGLLKSIFSLLGILAGLFLATRYNEMLASSLSFLKLESKLVSLVSFIIIVIFTYFIFTFIAKKLAGINVATKSFDRLLGACLGILKGLVIASLFLIFTTNTFNFFSKDTIDKSKFYTSVINIAPQVYDYAMQFFPNAKDFYKELNI